MAVGAGVVLAVAGAVAWLRIPAEIARPDKPEALPSLGLSKGGAGLSAELLAEQLAAYDPAPLFIPSGMNSSASGSSNVAQPGTEGPFAALPPELTKAGPVRFPSSVAVPANPIDGLRLTERADAPLAIARGDTSGAGLKERLGQLETVDAGSGRVVLNLALIDPVSPPKGDWQPLELMGAVTRTGLIGELVVIRSSGSGEIDDYFRSHLRQSVRIGARLPEGFYMFRVGP